MRVIYEAADGVQFDDINACARYEQEQTVINEHEFGADIPEGSLRFFAHNGKELEIDFNPSTLSDIDYDNMDQVAYIYVNGGNPSLERIEELFSGYDMTDINEDGLWVLDGETLLEETWIEAESRRKELNDEINRLELQYNSLVNRISIIDQIEDECE